MSLKSAPLTLSKEDWFLFILAIFALCTFIFISPDVFPEYNLQLTRSEDEYIKLVNDSLKSRGFIVPVQKPISDFPSTKLIQRAPERFFENPKLLNRYIGWQFQWETMPKDTPSGISHHPTSVEVGSSGEIVHLEFETRQKIKDNISIERKVIGIPREELPLKGIVTSKYYSAVVRFLYALSYVLVILLVIYGLYIFSRLIGKQVLPVIESVTVAFFILIVTAFTRLLTKPVDEGPLIGVALGIAFGSSILYGLVFLVGEPISKSHWYEKTVSFSDVLNGRFFLRNIGVSLCRGLCIGSIALIVITISRMVLPVSLIADPVTNQPSPYIQHLGIVITNWSSKLRLFDGAILIASFGAITFSLFFISLLKKHIKKLWLLLLVGSLSYTGVLVLDISSFSTTLFGYNPIITFITGLFFTIALFRFDIFSIFIAHITLTFIYQTLALTRMPLPPYFGNMLFLLLTIIGIGLAGLFISIKGKEYGESKLSLSKRLAQVTGFQDVLSYTLSFNEWRGLRRSGRIVYAIGTIILIAGSVALIFQILIIAWFGFSVNFTILFVSFGLIINGLFLQMLVAMQKVELDRVKFSHELRTAHSMQMALMPRRDPDIPGFEISGLCIPAEEVGGDYFDYIWLDIEKNHLGIVVADVSGKAMKAAITAVMLSGLISREIEGGNSPRTILHRINKTLHLKTERNTFTTMLFVSLNVITKTLTFSNAGHLRPIIIRNGVLQHLDTTGMGLPLGIMKDIEYNEAALQLQNNDIVILCSDGITETINEQDEFFELKGLEEVVRSLDYRMSAVEMVQSIIYKVNEFSGNAKQHDDITLVVVKVM